MKSTIAKINQVSKIPVHIVNFPENSVIRGDSYQIQSLFYNLLKNSIEKKKKKENEDGKIEGSDGTFKIDFVHLDIPTTSLEASGKVEFSKGTKYTLKDYPTDENVILYYTLDGSDPTISDNANRKAYSGEELT